jgi:hypothetical protein
MNLAGLFYQKSGFIPGKNINPQFYPNLAYFTYVNVRFLIQLDK